MGWDDPQVAGETQRWFAKRRVERHSRGSNGDGNDPAGRPGDQPAGAGPLHRDRPPRAAPHARDREGPPHERPRVAGPTARRREARQRQRRRRPGVAYGRSPNGTADAGGATPSTQASIARAVTGASRTPFRWWPSASSTFSTVVARPSTGPSPMPGRSPDQYRTTGAAPSDGTSVSTWRASAASPSGVTAFTNPA